MKQTIKLLYWLPFLGILFALHCDYNWYCKNQKNFLLYQFPATWILAAMIAFYFTH
jgi:hypothetical protein